MSSLPLLSVIVITHNRETQVVECIDMLSDVVACRTDVELIVVLDNCTDQSFERLRSFRSRLGSCLVLEAIQAGSPGVARNRGASLARGSILLFLDDDVRPSPALLDAHLRSQLKSDVVVGYLRPGLARKHDWWQLGARIWWEDRFTVMRQPDYRMGYQDLFSANFSVKASLFHSVGGFDENCPRLEDYELGIRFLKARASCMYDPEASVVHMETGSVGRWLGRASLEALGELHIGKKHPDFRQDVFRHRFVAEDPWITQWKSHIRKLAFRRNTIISAFIKAAAASLPFLESMKARHTWNYIAGGVAEYNYWKCIAQYFNTEPEFLAWVEGG